MHVVHLFHNFVIGNLDSSKWIIIPFQQLGYTGINLVFDTLPVCLISVAE